MHFADHIAQHTVFVERAKAIVANHLAGKWPFATDAQFVKFIAKSDDPLCDEVTLVVRSHGNRQFRSFPIPMSLLDLPADAAVSVKHLVEMAHARYLRGEQRRQEEAKAKAEAEEKKQRIEAAIETLKQYPETYQLYQQSIVTEAVQARAQEQAE